MKVVYKDIVNRLKTEVPALRWIDFDTGQLESSQRSAVAFPCALLNIAVNSTTDVTDTIQECQGTITIRIAFESHSKTNSSVQAEHLETSLQPYEVIADVYSALQGFGNDNFDPLSRVRQGKENNRNMFVYSIVFSITFDDETADKKSEG